MLVIIAQPTSSYLRDWTNKCFWIEKALIKAFFSCISICIVRLQIQAEMI